MRALSDKAPDTLKAFAHQLKMSKGTLQQHLSRIYLKFGWSGPASLRRLVLWTHEHRNTFDRAA